MWFYFHMKERTYTQEKGDYMFMNHDTKTKRYLHHYRYKKRKGREEKNCIKESKYVLKKLCIMDSDMFYYITLL
jgi:hypothetical protein